jgi:rhodanese-related sulfurtransferase
MSILDFLKWLPFGKVPEMSAELLHSLLEEHAGQVQLLDVRTTEEWHRSRIPGSINLPITSFSRTNIKALGLDPTRPVIAICLSAHRSRPAVRQLTAMGFASVAQLKQGMLHWWKLDLPCESS